MCGICGQIEGHRSRAVDRRVLERMNAAITHRGPDSEGYFLRDHAGLAMRRLAVIDLATGDQPMANADQTLWLVFNGEIYNFRELRAELEARGQTFSTHSDTEVVLRLYEAYGAAAVERLRGMFALAIWDVRTETLFLARDRFGKKPLYYMECAGGVIFGSELKCLLAHPAVPREADLDAIAAYLTLQYIPDPSSGFRGIRKLPPAHTLTWRAGKVTLARYWEPQYEPKLTGSEDALAAELRERLKESVRLRLIADVPLGAHLSGGLDSSVIVALMSELASGPVKTFSIGFEESGFSELPHARAVARHFGTEHEELVVAYGNIPELFATLVRSFDEPFADSSALPLYFLARMTRRHVTVALNGDGGDETLAGYQRYVLDRFANGYARLPLWVTQRLVPALLSRLREPMDRPIEANRLAGLKRLAQVAAISSKASIVRWGSYFSAPMQADLWRPEVAARLRGPDAVGLLAASFDGARATSFLDRTLAVDVLNYLPGDLLVKSDRMTMAHGLEGRSPFLDHEFAQWANRLPERMKIRGRTQKYLLRKAFERDLPASILSRGKQGFGIPLGLWFRGPLRGWAEDLLLAPEARIHGLFRHAAVGRLLQEHASGITDHGKRIWTLAALELWLREFQPKLG